MARRREEYLSPEIVNRGINNSGSPSFSVKVNRGLPDFLSSVNLKYVRLGYRYLINHGKYFAVLPVLLVIIGTQIGKLTWDGVFSLEYYNLVNTLLLSGFLSLFVYVYLDLTPRSTYLVDFACYLPPNELKVSIYLLSTFLISGIILLQDLRLIFWTVMTDNERGIHRVGQEIRPVQRCSN
ncbi:hypothetical protein ABFS82_12G133600 [Erythranthe guttata]